MRIRSALAVFFISIFILFPIRLTTLTSGVDLSGNLFIGGTMPSVFTAVLILSVLLILIITKKAINVPSYVRVMRSIPCTFASIIMAGLVAYDSALSLGGEYADIFVDERSIIYGVFGLLSAVTLILFAFSFLTGNPIAPRVPIITLIPSIWACLRLTFMFMNFTTMADISPYYFDIGYYICLLLFLFGQAKIFSSIETRKSVKLSVWSGLLCCIFSLLSVCTRFYINTFKEGDYTASTIIPRIMDVFVIVYILCYLFFVTKGEHKTHKHEEIHFIDFQTNANYNDFWNDLASNQNRIEQINPINNAISIAPVAQNTQIEQIDIMEQIEQTLQFRSINQAEQLFTPEQAEVSENTEASESVQQASADLTAPADLQAPADYYDEDDDNISIFPDKKLLKSELDSKKTESSLNGNPDNPTAHIEGTEDISDVSAEIKSVPNYIETPDGVYVRVVDAVTEEQVVEASPDEAPSGSTSEKNPDRPTLGKGYVPKSTVKMTEDGYCIINCPDE